MSETRDDDVVERELLAAARSGDDGAFAALYLRHQDSALAYAHSLTHPARAPDLFAEAVLRIYRLVQNGKGPETAFRTYLFMTIRSVNIDSLRRSGREIPVADILEAADQAHADSAESLADRDTILRAFRTLPQRWQDILWATAVEGRSIHDLGSELALAPNSVAVLSRRAREGLRQAYLSQHIETIPADRQECQPYARDLARYVRGALVPNRHQSVHAHLQRCPDCALIIAGLEGINTHLGALLLPALLVPLGATAYGAGVALRTHLGALKARVVDLPRIGQLFGSLSGPSVAAVAGSVVLATSATIGVAVWRHDRPTARPKAASSYPEALPGRITPPIASPSTEAATPRPTGAAREAVPKRPDARPQPSRKRPEGARTASPGREAGQSDSPSPTPPALVPASPTPTPAAEPSGNLALVVTPVGSCSMEAAALVCADQGSAGGRVLVLTPADGGTCSGDDQLADCHGPLTISDRTAPGPDSGEPQVLYTQTGSTDSCTVRDQVLTCYHGS